MEKFEFELPEDIVLNILLRLPIMCFLRFRSVCKVWYSLLSDPIFMYKNLTFINSDDDPHLQLLIKHCHLISNSNTPRKTLHNDFSLISFHNLHSKRYLPFTHKEDIIIIVVGSYNGLVCLTDCATEISVWNPLTEETKVLPKSPNYTDSEYYDEQYDLMRFEVGFCFDANANDYKVIKIFHRKDYTNYPNAVFLYSFRSDCWKKLDFSLRLDAFDVPQLFMTRTPINSDGKFYHWIADTPVLDDGDIPSLIVSFDMNLESFKTTEIPYTWNYHQPHDESFCIGFFMLKDFVAISATPMKSYEAGAPIFEISVLLRIGVKESWTKLITIGPLADVEKILLPWKNGSLFLQTCKGDVMVFDPFTREIVLLLPSNRTPPHYIQLMTYKGGHVQSGAINIG